MERIAQLSFEDVAKYEIVKKEPRRFAFIDEAGSFGFDFDKQDVQSFYIVCAVIVNEDHIPEIERKVEEIRKYRFGGGEMKSKNIGNNHTKRTTVFADLLAMDFSILFLIADKRKFAEQSPLKDYKQSFIKYLHQKLYEAMYSSFPKLSIIEDEHGTSEFQAGYKKYVQAHRHEYNLLEDYNFDFVNSKNSNIVQIADILAGSALHRLEDNSYPDVFRIFKGSIIDIIRFPIEYAVLPQNHSRIMNRGMITNCNGTICRHCNSVFIQNTNARTHILRSFTFALFIILSHHSLRVNIMPNRLEWSENGESDAGRHEGNESASKNANERIRVSGSC